MDESEHNLRIEKIAEMILSDKISLDTQEQNILKKYHDFAKENYHLDQDSAAEQGARRAASCAACSAFATKRSAAAQPPWSRPPLMKSLPR